MKINIISNQFYNSKNRGPKKVLNNLLLGLDLLKIEYVFNKPISKYKFNWIHDSPSAIIEAGFVGKNVLIGPNIAELPGDLPIIRKNLSKDSIYLHPSTWPMKIWKFEGYNETKLKSWPVGIDTEKFSMVNRENKGKILLYFKQRDKNLLEKAEKIIVDEELEARKEFEKKQQEKKEDQ